MARSLCRCGEQILWKADEPQSDEILFVAKHDLTDDWSDLFRAARPAALCSACGRIWVAPDPKSADLVEYLPQEPG